MSNLVGGPEIQALLDRVSGVDQARGDARTKAILRRIVSDLFATIEEFDVGEDEFWRAVTFLQQAAPEFGLIAPGLGFEHFLDVRMDMADRAAGVTGGTPRTIEGPLYVGGAPLSDGVARLDDGVEKGEVLVMHGRVLDTARRPVAGAVVDVWHANTLGAYSRFDPSQAPYNYRRRIRTLADGAYRFRTLMPAGYAVPKGGSTERLLDAIGRHGRRPAHIHFFVSAPGKRLLTTQINIAGDPDLHDDFAYATRDGLIPDVVKQADPEAIRAESLNAPFSEIAFDFVLLDANEPSETVASTRVRAVAG